MININETNEGNERIERNERNESNEINENNESNENNLIEIVSQNHQLNSAFINDVDIFGDNNPISRKTTETTNANLTSASNIPEQENEIQVEQHQVVKNEESPNSKTLIEDSVSCKITQEEKEQIQENKQTETKKDIPKFNVYELPLAQKILSKRVGNKLLVLYQNIKTKGFYLLKYTMTNPEVFPIDYKVREDGTIRYSDPLSMSEVASDFRKYYNLLISQKDE